MTHVEAARESLRGEEVEIGDLYSRNAAPSTCIFDSSYFCANRKRYLFQKNQNFNRILASHTSVCVFFMECVCTKQNALTLSRVQD